MKSKSCTLDMPMCSTVCRTTCCPTHPQQVEALEFGLIDLQKL